MATALSDAGQPHDERGGDGPASARRGDGRAGAPGLRRSALEAGAAASIAATLYALVLVLVRTGGAERAVGVLACLATLAALGLLRRDPATAQARLARRPFAAATATGALLGAALALTGTAATLLFLPAVVLLATLGMVVAPRAVAAGAALAAAGQLSALLRAEPAFAERRLACAAALGLLLIPVALAALLERVVPAAAPPAAGDAPEEPPAQRPPTPAPPPVAGVPPVDVLTPRQREVVALTRAGLRHGEIAQRLGVSVQHVRRLLRQARERTGTSTTRELTAWSIAAGLAAPTGNPSETQARLRDD